eukprot:747566-Hanusia_phi.AAC.5
MSNSRFTSSNSPPPPVCLSSALHFFCSALLYEAALPLRYSLLISLSSPPRLLASSPRPFSFPCHPIDERKLTDRSSRCSNGRNGYLTHCPSRTALFGRARAHSVRGGPTMCTDNSEYSTGIAGVVHHRCRNLAKFRDSECRQAQSRAAVPGGRAPG